MRLFSALDTRLVLLGLLTLCWPQIADAQPAPPDPCQGAQTCVVETGTYVGPFGPVEGEYVVVDGQPMIGDMLIDTVEECANCLSIVRGTERWPNAVIPYLLDDTLSDEARASVLEAIEIVNAETVLRFVPQSDEVAHVVFLNTDDPEEQGACRSRVGRSGEAQAISITDWCEIRVGTVIHEMLHAAGVWHEHQRADRNDFVDVLWSNIGSGHHNYNLIGGESAEAWGRYDFSSIMHYPFVFSGDRLVMLPHDVAYPTTTAEFDDLESLFNREALTDGDIASLATMYAPILESAAKNDKLGTAVATGDFNGDGFDDLAIGVPGEDHAGFSNVGAVHFVYGMGAGLSHENNGLWRPQSGPAMPTPAPVSSSLNRKGESPLVRPIGRLPLPESIDEPVRESFAKWGTTLASGDFDADGFDDVAIGAPYYDAWDAPNSGAVVVLRGSTTGPQPVPIQVWSQAVLPGSSIERNEHFGAALAVGDFDDDGYEDLAIGVPGDEVAGRSAAGGVHVLFGSQTSLDAAGHVYRNRNHLAVAGAVAAGDRFGSALAAGRFRVSGPEDLAIGIPLANVASVANAGAVLVLHGHRNGASNAFASGTLISQIDIEGSIENEPSDQFGASLAAGRFSGSQLDDLVIGVPGEDLGSSAYTRDVGRIVTLPGSYSGPHLPSAVGWHLAMPELGVQVRAGDLFGASLATGDFDADGFEDIAVGATGADPVAYQSCGAVFVLDRGWTGPAGAGLSRWHQNTRLIADYCENGDRFGHALAAGDFDADGFADLAVGIPFEDIEEKTNAGAVATLLGRDDGLSNDGDAFWHQDR